jgi:hypothetical protein
MAITSKVSARAQRYNDLARTLRAIAALIERRLKRRQPIEPGLVRTLRSAALRFADAVDPNVRKSLQLIAQAGEHRALARVLATRAQEGARRVRKFEGERSRSESLVVAANLIDLARELGLVERGLRENERALGRLRKALENKQFRLKLKLAKLVLEAAGVGHRNALDWTAPPRKSK